MSEQGCGDNHDFDRDRFEELAEKAEDNELDGDEIDEFREQKEAFMALMGNIMGTFIEYWSVVNEPTEDPSSEV